MNGTAWVALWLAACGTPPASPPRADAPPAWTSTAAEPVGSAACAGCHDAQTQAWTDSQHHRALLPGDQAAGPFDGTVVAHGEERLSVATVQGQRVYGFQGTDGADVVAPVTWVMGVDPLQQLLVQRPDGRWQASSLAWDARPVDAGGQRWFALLPDEATPPGDALHGDGPAYNADHMCLECHTTGFLKGYDPQTQRFASTWDEAGVGCEACHGPGARHAAWAAAGAQGDDHGLLVTLAGNDLSTWIPDPALGVRKPSTPPTATAQVDSCARCHARRTTLTDTPAWGGSLLDTHRPSLLDAGLYLPDGQIEDEVYVWGSFMQSRMQQVGVVCSDCHEPHGGKLRRQGDATCTACHDDARFGGDAHQHHGDAALACVDCHMPRRTYMEVDPRRDHGFQVPRPQHADTLDVREPCTACHTDRDRRWAAQQATALWGDTARPRDRWTQALALGRTAGVDAPLRLREVVGDAALPGIVRATAASLLARWPSPATLLTLAAGARDPDPLVRLGAVAGAGGLSGAGAGRVLGSLLHDPVRAVREEAARSWASTEATSAALPAGDRGDLRGWEASQQRNADRAEALVSLGAWSLEKGDMTAGQAAFQAALAREPWSIQARANLADVRRSLGDEAAAARLLDDGLRITPTSSVLLQSRGLSKVRSQALDAALVDLRQAVAVGPDDPGAVFLLAVALHDTGHPDEALAALEKARQRMPSDPQVLYALATFAREAGRPDLAVDAGTAWSSLDPTDPTPRALLQQLSAPTP